MSKLNAGDVFRRKHGFVRPYPGYWRQDVWWSATSNRPATAEGWAYLEIIEVVETATFGRMVIYREWWIDPDGNEVEPTQNWIPDKETADIREHRNVLRSITSKKMEAVSRGADAALSQAVAPVRTAAVIDKPRGEPRLDLGSMRTWGSA